jgi:hypothetical protein
VALDVGGVLVDRLGVQARDWAVMPGYRHAAIAICVPPLPPLR